VNKKRCNKEEKGEENEKREKKTRRVSFDETRLERAKAKMKEERRG